MGCRDRRAEQGRTAQRDPAQLGLSQHEAETAESSGVPTGDYHEFFEIHNIPTQPELIESKLIFWGVPEEHSHVGTPRAFITLPST